MNAFKPENLSVVAACNNPALGRATEIMFKAMGFARVHVVPTDQLCQQATKLRPTFIIFSPEYLALPVEDMLACGCPCKSKVGCIDSLSVIFLRKKSADTVLQSKQMGFDGIIFADDTMERLLNGLKTVYDTRGRKTLDGEY